MSQPYRLLDLFSGIGGFSLGLERTGGFKTVAFCEIDPFCRRVLAKHWPEVPCYDDVTTLTGERLAADGIAVDAICGGFPCQDISSAGGRVGIDGARSGLWSHYARIVGEVRPRLVVIENVRDLLSRGLDRVLQDLAALGYDAEWHCIQAAAVDAPHLRDRVWIIAYPDSASRSAIAANPSNGRAVSSQGIVRHICGGDRGESPLAYADSKSLVGPAIAWSQYNPWAPEPEVGRVDNGISARVAREQLRALGNAVVPQIPELIGRAILAADRSMTAHVTDLERLSGGERL